MITLERLTTVDDTYYSQFWELYVLAFPSEERRGADYQALTLNKRDYHLESILLDGEFIGFIAWWQLGGLRYIEHLATKPSVRGAGYGEKVLRAFMRESDVPLLLEVEHPTDSLKSRRIAFYERLGFKLNHYSYKQPSFISKEEEGVDLLVMTFPKTISESDLRLFEKEELPKVHFYL